MDKYKQGWTNVYIKWKKNPKKTESSSGVGSSITRTINVRKIITDIINNYKIKSIIDCPCGDFKWMNLIDLTNIKYLGIDIVDEKIKDNNKKYKKSNIKFKSSNVINDKIKTYADLIICRDIFPHLTFKDSIQLLYNLLYCNPKYILMTTFPDHDESKELNSYKWGPINVEIQPYKFKCKIDCFNEKDPELINTNYKDKSLILLDGIKLKQLIKIMCTTSLSNSIYL